MIENIYTFKQSFVKATSLCSMNSGWHVDTVHHHEYLIL